jgi:hypothetical protein
MHVWKIHSPFSRCACQFGTGRTSYLALYYYSYSWYIVTEVQFYEFMNVYEKLGFLSFSTLLASMTGLPARAASHCSVEGEVRKTLVRFLIRSYIGQVLNSFIHTLWFELAHNNVAYCLQLMPCLSRMQYTNNFYPKISSASWPRCKVRWRYLKDWLALSVSRYVAYDSLLLDAYVREYIAINIFSLHFPFLDNQHQGLIHGRVNASGETNISRGSYAIILIKTYRRRLKQACKKSFIMKEDRSDPFHST